MENQVKKTRITAAIGRRRRSNNGCIKMPQQIAADCIFLSGKSQSEKKRTRRTPERTAGGSRGRSAVLVLLVPGHLDSFENPFARFRGIVGEIGERHHPLVQVGEPHGQRIDAVEPVGKLNRNLFGVLPRQFHLVTPLWKDGFQTRPYDGITTITGPDIFAWHASRDVSVSPSASSS